MTPRELNTLLGITLPAGAYTLQNVGDSDLYYIELNSALPDPSVMRGVRKAHVLRGSPYKDDVPITKGAFFYLWTIEGLTTMALTEAT